MSIRILPFIIPLFIGGLIQVIKVLVDILAHKRKFSISAFWIAGGFPSVHSGISSSITTLVGLIYGLDSMTFAICLTFAILFWYDAANVRYEAGKHAKYINEIKDELKSFSFIDYKLQDLQERLWHTSTEVVGGILVGSITTVAIYYLLPHLLPIIIG